MGDVAIFMKKLFMGIPLPHYDFRLLKVVCAEKLNSVKPYANCREEKIFGYRFNSLERGFRLGGFVPQKNQILQ